MNEQHISRIINSSFKDLIHTKSECDSAFLLLNLTHDPGTVYNYAKSVMLKKSRAYFQISKRFDSYLDGSTSSTNSGFGRSTTIREVQERVPYLDANKSLNQTERSLLQISKNVEKKSAQDLSQSTLHALNNDRKRKLNQMQPSATSLQPPLKKVKMEPIQPEELSKKLEEFALEAKMAVTGKQKFTKSVDGKEALLVQEIGLFIMEYLVRPCDLNITLDNGAVDANQRNYAVNLKSNGYLAFDSSLLKSRLEIMECLDRTLVNAKALFGRESALDLVSLTMYNNFKRNDIVTKFVDGYFFVLCYIKAVLSILAGATKTKDRKQREDTLYVVNEWMYQISVYLVAAACLWYDMSLDGFIQCRRESLQNPQDFDDITFYGMSLKEKVLKLACWLSVRNYRYDDPNFVAAFLSHCKMYAEAIGMVYTFHMKELVELYRTLEEDCK